MNIEGEESLFLTKDRIFFEIRPDVGPCIILCIQLYNKISQTL